MIKKYGLKRLYYAWGYSLAGLKAAFRHEAAFRQEILLLLLFGPLAFWLGRTPVETALLLASLLLILIVELLNSAIEAVVDRIGTTPSELSGRAKDLGSAAVLLTILVALCIWGSVLIGYG